MTTDNTPTNPAGMNFPDFCHLIHITTDKITDTTNPAIISMESDAFEWYFCSALYPKPAVTPPNKRPIINDMVLPFDTNPMNPPIDTKMPYGIEMQNECMLTVLSVLKVKE